jgi:3-hydroxymyristoyl/3-hydroxydecanoyl-(acyl carrier protein) dehydratase
MDQLFQSAIQRIIPHRYPFLLVDRVTEFHPGERIVGIKNFTANEASLEGQFAAGDWAPTSLLIEMVTQLGAILVLERPGMEGKVAVILQAPMARLLRPVRLGESLRVEAEVVRFKKNFGEMRGWAMSGDERVAEGQMRFAVTDASAVAPALSDR